MKWKEEKNEMEKKLISKQEIENREFFHFKN